MISFFRGQMDLAEEDFFSLKPKDGIWEGDVTGFERTINKSQPGQQGQCWRCPEQPGTKTSLFKLKNGLKS